MSNVNSPTHYNTGAIEVILAIEDWKLNFHLGNAVKYVARAGKKDPSKKIEDLEKAIYYIKRYIEIEGQSVQADIVVSAKLKVDSLVDCHHEWEQIGPMECRCLKCQIVAKS